MIVQEDGSFFTLEALPVSEDGYGLPFSVKVSSEGFGGEVHYVNVNSLNWKTF
jgi:hypothetical protein